MHSVTHLGADDTTYTVAAAEYWPEACAACGGGWFGPHDTYERWGLTQLIDIHRFRCHSPGCRRVWSVLPSYLTRFQSYATLVEMLAGVGYVLGGKTYAEVARDAGVSVTTAFRWVTDGALTAAATLMSVLQTILAYAPEQPVETGMRPEDLQRAALWQARRVRQPKIPQLLEMCVLVRCLEVFAAAFRPAAPLAKQVPSWGIWRWATYPLPKWQRIRATTRCPAVLSWSPEVDRMNKETRSRSALRRYAMIDALADRELKPGEKATLLAEAQQRYGVSLSTLKRYLKGYAAQRIDGLERQPRTDRGKPRRVLPEALELVIQLRAEEPTRTTKTLIAMVEDEHPEWIGLLKRSTLDRCLAQMGKSRKLLGQDTAPRRRFAKTARGALMQMDICIPPLWVADENGEVKQAVLVAADTLTKVQAAKPEVAVLQATDVFTLTDMDLVDPVPALHRRHVLPQGPLPGRQPSQTIPEATLVPRTAATARRRRGNNQPAQAKVRHAPCSCAMRFFSGI
jgi:transposase